MLLAACAAYGLVVGSFLNVVIHRVPRHASIVSPRSRCPDCGSELQARDNIPVLSWLLLRGRCRTCRKPISARYPLIELLTAALFVAGGVRFGLVPELPSYLILFGALVALSAIDLEHLILPRAIVYPTLAATGAALAVAAVVDGRPDALVRALGGAGLAWGVLFAIHLVQPRGMGFGDVRLALLLGLHLGWLGLGHVALGLFLGFVLGALVGGGLVVARRHDRRNPLPFGPFLAAGTVIAVLFGEPLLDRYPPLQEAAPVRSATPD